MKTNDPGFSAMSWVAILQQHVASVRYGKIEIVVHDGKVVQIDTTHKLRLEMTDSGQNPISERLRAH